MSDDDPSTQPAQSRSWFERLGQALAGDPRDREDLIELLHDAQERGLFDADALAMLEGVLQVADMQVRDVMVPRAQMVVIEKDAGLDEVLPVIIESGHSRFPVIGDSRDEVVGIVLAKDLLRHCTETGTAFSVNEYLRPVPFIPESKRLNMLLKDFRASRNHMAVVVDEYGGVAGLVTIEDVLEQIVGEIDDEHDVDDEVAIVPHGDREFTVKALTPVEDFNEYFHTDFSDEEVDTIGGLIVHHFAHMPKRGEQITLGPCRFKVLRADSRRVHLLQVSFAGAAE
ncbi:MAG TPA: transporter associated domain-containing protein [Gammaproteobacteria bacterium]|jgi:magnesium and cobalt transporter|nr:transporter associated domain-containing protein [Gammaproteobacteria bacterium]